MKIYVDSSFLVSLFSLDVNSRHAVSALQASPGERLVTTFGELEVINALKLRVFRKEISATQAHSSLLEFESLLREGVFQLRELLDTFFERARQLSQRTTAKSGTRTSGVLHVAAALELRADYLFSFDQKQRKLAQSVRLKVN